MRGAFIHVFTGLLLGVALAGLLHAPTELVAQQEARTSVVRPKGVAAGQWVEEHTVRVSPRVERDLERQRARRLRLEKNPAPRPPFSPPSPPVFAPEPPPPAPHNAVSGEARPPGDPQTPPPP